MWLIEGGDDGRYTFKGSYDMTKENGTAKYILQVIDTVLSITWRFDAGFCAV